MQNRINGYLMKQVGLISNGDEENENKNNPDNILRGKYEYAKSNKWVFDETSGYT